MNFWQFADNHPIATTIVVVVCCWLFAEALETIAVVCASGRKKP